MQDACIGCVLAVEAPAVFTVTIFKMTMKINEEMLPGCLHRAGCVAVTYQ